MDFGNMEILDLKCEMCDHIGLIERDGEFYCQDCRVRANGLMDTAVDAEDLTNTYQRTHTRNSIKKSQKSVTGSPMPTPITGGDGDGNAASSLPVQEQGGATTAAVKYNDDGKGPKKAEDSGEAPVLKFDVRLRYLLGLQQMIEFQCEALVRDFHLTPLICGIAKTVWLRFVAGTGVCKDDWANGVFKDDWAKDVRLESEPVPPQLSDRPKDCKLEPVCIDESQEPGNDNLLKDSHIRYPNVPYNSRDLRKVMIRFRWLRKKIPLSTSLAIVFLASHLAREAVLPTDIIKWSIEGKLPYFAAHMEIEKQPYFSGFPISTSLMFRPYRLVHQEKLESMAATISACIGLHLPPVNFYEIASRYLKQLSLPVQKILPRACRIYEWSMPPDLWLSTNENRLPTRVYVLAMLIVSIRIQYGINGFGVWERSLSTHTGMDREKGSSFPPQTLGLDAEELLVNLEKKYHELSDPYDFAKDLPSYLQHCKDVIFAESRSSRLKDVEKELIEKLMQFYQNEKYSEAGDDESQYNGVCSKKRSRDDDDSESHSRTSPDTTRSQPHLNGNRDDGDALRRLKLDMEENRFGYITPRVNIKRRGYLAYARKKDVGALAYAVHADYYILLRACARVAKVDVRIMHVAVQSFERRLAWLEERIDRCLHSTPSGVTCESCSGAPDTS